jgi:hypothetical protein
MEAIDKTNFMLALITFWVIGEGTIVTLCIYWICSMLREIKRDVRASLRRTEDKVLPPPRL